MRCNYTFTYVSMAGKDPEALGAVNGIMVDSIGAPKQGHLSLGNSDTEMVVSFTSGSSKTPSVRFVALSWKAESCECVYQINQSISV